MKLKYNVAKDFPSKGIVFIDFMPTFTDYKTMNDVANLIAKKIKDKVDCIIMPESRGYLLGAMIASKLKINAIPIRKHGKLPKEFVGATEEYQTEYSKTQLDIPAINLKGKTCYFIDDVYATGGTYYACKNLVEKLGGIMLGGFCLYTVGIDDNEEITYIMSKEDI